MGECSLELREQDSTRTVSCPQTYPVTAASKRGTRNPAAREKPRCAAFGRLPCLRSALRGWGRGRYPVARETIYKLRIALPSLANSLLKVLSIFRITRLRRWPLA